MRLASNWLVALTWLKYVKSRSRLVAEQKNIVRWSRMTAGPFLNTPKHSKYEPDPGWRGVGGLQGARLHAEGRLHLFALSAGG